MHLHLAEWIKNLADSISALDGGANGLAFNKFKIGSRAKMLKLMCPANEHRFRTRILSRLVCHAIRVCKEGVTNVKTCASTTVSVHSKDTTKT